MAGSNALAVKAALKAKVDSLPELADVQRTWGLPARQPDKRWCLIGQVQWEKSDWATNRSREERFSIKVVLSVQITGATAEDVETACMNYATEIEAALKADPKLGQPNVVTSSFVPRELNSFPLDGVIEGQLEAEYQVTARF